MTVNVHEAKTHLSRLLEAVEQGEDVVIARSGKPVARLVPALQRGVRQPGVWAGRITMADDFDDIPAGMLASMSSEIEPPSA